MNEFIGQIIVMIYKSNMKQRIKSYFRKNIIDALEHDDMLELRGYYDMFNLLNEMEKI